MKTKKRMSMLALLLILALSVTAVSAEEFGAGRMTEDGPYSIEEMLTYAIEDEYLAQAEYKMIIDHFGVDRPFSNIMRAEGVHIELLLPLLEAYDAAVPENMSARHVVLPDSLAEIFEPCVEAEIVNIAMYETFLEQDNLPDDVRDVFESLKRASENHLAAFERNSERVSGKSGIRDNRWERRDESDFAFGGRPSRNFGRRGR